MQSVFVRGLLGMFLGAALFLGPAFGEEAAPEVAPEEDHAMEIALPAPRNSGDVSIEETLAQRRSIRGYSEEPLTLAEAGQLLWAAQGVTAEWGARTAPSAGALYPLETHLVAGAVDGLPKGLYRYHPSRHTLTLVREGDLRFQFCGAALGQRAAEEAAVSVIFSGVYSRTAARYGERAERYVHMEAGHAAQNVALQAVALGLGSVPVGAFDDAALSQIMGLDEDETPLYIVPVGRLK